MSYCQLLTIRNLTSEVSLIINNLIFYIIIYNQMNKGSNSSAFLRVALGVEGLEQYIEKIKNETQFDVPHPQLDDKEAYDILNKIDLAELQIKDE